LFKRNEFGDGMAVDSDPEALAGLHAAEKSGRLVS
jgi:hypothetical protein